MLNDELYDDIFDHFDLVWFVWADGCAITIGISPVKSSS